MGVLDAVTASSRSRLAGRWPALAGLIASAAATSLLALPPTHRISRTELLGFATEYLISVSLACVVTACVVHAATTRNGRFDRRTLNASSLAAVWIPPLALCIGEGSFLTIVVAAVFSVIATQLFEDEKRPDDIGSSASLIVSLWPEEAPLFPARRLNFFVVAALVAQIGTLAVFAGYSLVGAILVGASFSLWTWFRASDRTLDAWPASSNSDSRGLILATLAVLCTIAGLIPYLQINHGFAGFGVPSRAHSRHSYARNEPGPQTSLARLAQDLESYGGEGNPGIVLWPDKQVVTKLVAPTPVRELNALTIGHSADPLVIPFNGVYWFFKAPDAQPPRSSKQAHASPESVEIRSTDHRPLLIEAHDHLGTLIDLDCCSRIEIAIRNADRYPETVSLELVLVNSSVTSKPSESFGRTMVKSTRPWKIYDKPTPVSETLDFALPKSSRLRRFDEVKIVFRLDPARADSGAKIAIDHLVLVPRGL